MCELFIADCSDFWRSILVLSFPKELSDENEQLAPDSSLIVLIVSPREIFVLEGFTWFDCELSSWFIVACFWIIYPSSNGFRDPKSSVAASDF
jgi:hypothetical protein